MLLGIGGNGDLEAADLAKALLLLLVPGGLLLGVKAGGGVIGLGLAGLLLVVFTAVYLGVNLEHFAFGEGLGAELAPGGPQPDVLNYAWRDWGNRVGAWRLLDLLDELALPATVLLNSAMYDYAPALVAAHRARGDEIAGVFAAPERPGARPDPLVTAADEKKLPVFRFPKYSDPEAQNALRELKADIGVMAYVLLFAPPEFCAIPKHGMIQFHPSLLPLYPGLDTHARALAAGDRQAGCTVHEVTAELDAGPILGQARVPILPGDTAETLAARVLTREHLPELQRTLEGLFNQTDWPDYELLILDTGSEDPLAEPRARRRLRESSARSHRRPWRRRPAHSCRRRSAAPRHNGSGSR